MPTVPIDEGPRDRRRIGPFWIEEGTGLLVVGGAILAAFTVLYVLAVLARPH
jgi:cytochrome bd-type quinol oxidase subunit 2